MNREINGNLDLTGFPIMDVALNGNENKGFIHVRALIDTGSSRCAIQKEILPIIVKEFWQNSKILHPVLHEVPVEEYLIDLMVDCKNPAGCKVVKQVRCCVIDEPRLEVGLLIGVELLKYFTLNYDGVNKCFSLKL